MLTYGYRDMGAPRQPPLRRQNSTVEDWRSKDYASVVHWVKTRFPQATLAGMRRGVGALVTGFVTNGRDIDKMLWVGGTCSARSGA